MRSLVVLFGLIVLLTLAASRAVSPPLPAAGSLDFNRDIEPILADNCYQCHGPDPGGRKAKMRLDRAADAFAKLKDDATPIVAGKPDESEVIKRIESNDPEDRMPPGPREPLSAEQKAVLRQWIAQGAKYRDHWSFEKPVRPAMPPVPLKLRSWIKNPIDAYVLANQRKADLEPSPEATRRELIRRVTLDLTGLLPTPAEVDAFVSDDAPDAYEKVVDRLLASPRYGEHRARYWLDVVRYGDTHGLHNDNYREVWPYRDYVIKAFNENKPFDQFAVEQLAGDLLPPTDVDQLVATGFVRCNLSTGEGGTILEEIRASNNRDRAEAYGVAFLGLTVGCAVCHDHKFDPITQKDFYQLTAFFNNIAERPSNDDRADPPPSIRVPTTQQRPEYNKVLGQKAELQKKLNARKVEVDSLIKGWLAGNAKPQAVSGEKLQLHFRLDENKGASVTNLADGKAYTFTGSAPVWGEETWLWPSLRLEAATRLQLPDTGNFEKDQPFSGGTWVQPRFNPTAIGDVPTGALMSRIDSAHAERGWDLLDENGLITVHLINHWPDNAIKVQTTTGLQRGEWHHAFFAYDGSGKAAGVKIYVDGKPQPTKALSDTLSGSIRSEVPWELGRRHEGAALKLARFQDVRLYGRALSPEEAARLPFEDYVSVLVTKPPESWNTDQRHAVVEFYLNDVDTAAKQLTAQIAALDQQLTKLAEGGSITLVCRENPSQLAYADVLSRGVYTARAERVRPAAPHFLPRPAAGSPQDRLGLARWTVSDDNPLTARVTVNRMWQELFGLGLVETPGDFGLMGVRSTNPDLLDWLAVEFHDSHWNMKHMYRLLVTSATYRQSARAATEQRERDSQNRLLARGPRFRMDAEMLRDTALQAAGLLVDHVGGPSVHPYQPPGIWEALRGLATTPQNWVQDKGTGTYRRSLYTFLKRQAPTPDMETLNSPNRDVACTRRDRTNTPLQALVLWDDPQWVEASRLIAQRAIREAGESPEIRLNFIANLLLCRPLTGDEQRIFLDAAAKFQAKYAADEKAAAALLAVGDTKADPSLSPADLASWTLVASEMINTDEALNK